MLKRAVLSSVFILLAAVPPVAAQSPIEVPDTWNKTGLYAAALAMALIGVYLADRRRNRLNAASNLPLREALEREQTRCMVMSSRIDEMREELRCLNRNYRHLSKIHARVLGRLEALGEIPMAIPTTLEESDTGRRVSVPELQRLREVLGRD